mmetsp:Transcript_54335/g.145034  ORF Transcript_54335/g.145034 Transcript_54335/m.145034 type:complete len:138 (-) Transcript_54335:196-609(-)
MGRHSALTARRFYETGQTPKEQEAAANQSSVSQHPWTLLASVAADAQLPQTPAKFLHMVLRALHSKGVSRGGSCKCSSKHANCLATFARVFSCVSQDHVCCGHDLKPISIQSCWTQCTSSCKSRHRMAPMQLNSVKP